MYHSAPYIQRIIGSVLGGLTALLLARLVLKLVAARPDNPIFAAVFAITAPLQVLVALDAGQPHFGAVLEFSTLALIGILLVASLLLRRFWPSD